MDLSDRLIDNWHAMEQQWRKLVEEGHVLDVAVTIEYPANSRRPLAYYVGQAVDGGPETLRDFLNPTE